MTVTFPVSGVDIAVWIPIVVAAVISSVTSVGGISGAFLILPFQVSVLGFTGPAVSATNLLFNVIAIPAGVYGFIRERRMVWAITVPIILGTLPGVLAGVMIRISFMPDPRTFKLFVAAVLLLIGYRIARDIGKRRGATRRKGDFTVDGEKLSLRSIAFSFEGENYIVPTPVLFLISIVVGMIGGIYGVGGGALIGPFLIATYRLPVHTIAGATLTGTFLTSVVGVAFYTIIGEWGGQVVSPDWGLGLLFGLGGVIGIWCGARLQKFLSDRLIRIIILICILIVVAKYVHGFFFVH